MSNLKKKIFNLFQILLIKVIQIFPKKKVSTKTTLSSYMSYQTEPYIDVSQKSGSEKGDHSEA